VSGKISSMGTRELIRDLLNEQNGICPLCGKPASFRVCNIDHKQPRSLGGGNERANLQATHIECNTRKGNGGIVNPPTFGGSVRVKTKKIPKDLRFSTATVNRMVKEKS